MVWDSIARVLSRLAVAWVGLGDPAGGAPARLVYEPILLSRGPVLGSLRVWLTPVGEGTP